MFFQIVGKITGVETIATGRGIRCLDKLKEKYGGKNWKKKKGFATVVLKDGSQRSAEVHWYEAHGVGEKEHKIKRLL